MTVLENVELCAKPHTELQEVNSAQKIKLRNSSYSAIINQYLAFATKIGEQENHTVNVGVMSEPTAEVIQVVAVNPRIAEIINLLEVKGRLRSEGYKALKIKPVMHDCIKKNSESGKENIAQPVVPESVEENKDAELEGQQQQTADVILPVSKPETDLFKVTKNESSAAKLEKYTQEPKTVEVEETKEELIVSEEEKAVSPTVIEAESARPISRAVPIIAPERIHEVANEITYDPKQTAEAISTALSNITSLGQLRECLARTAELKQAAEQAKTKATTAKESVERAEKEREDSKEKMLRTAEKIAAHQESLIAEAEQSNAQASMYEARRGELEAETAEYQKAIDDMLALIGDEDKTKKEKPM